MFKRHKRHAIRTGILLISLLIALTVISVSYARWSDTVSITGSVNTAIENDALGVSYPPRINPSVPPDPITGEVFTSIICYQPFDYFISNPDPDTVHFLIQKVMPGISYCCDFYIRNDGTVPTRVSNIQIQPASSGFLEITISGVNRGTFIYPGECIVGTVSAQLFTTSGEGQDLTVEVAFEVVRWNLYDQ